MKLYYRRARPYQWSPVSKWACEMANRQCLPQVFHSGETVDTITVPYVQGTSELIHRVIAKENIRVAFKRAVTLRQDLIHPKHPTPLNDQCSAIYHMPCHECEQTHVGDTAIYTPTNRTLFLI